MPGLYYAVNEFRQIGLDVPDDETAMEAGAALAARLPEYFEVWFNDGLAYRMLGAFNVPAPTEPDPPYYTACCKWGRMPLDATTDATAITEGLAYAARNGARVWVNRESHTEPDRLVAKIPPTWVTDTVLYLAFGVASLDAPADFN
jgi:hypothetical protein